VLAVRDVVLAHIKTLGLRLNAKKSVLSPAQRTTFLGSRVGLSVNEGAEVFFPRGNPLSMKWKAQCLELFAIGFHSRQMLLYGAGERLCSAQGLWVSHHPLWQINCLERMAVFNALRHFQVDLRGHNVLVHTDITSVVSYINHQGGLRSRPLYKLVHQILLWSLGKFLSLRAIYVPGHQNVGADILSRQGLRPR